jgi:hypothetical protein
MDHWPHGHIVFAQCEVNEAVKDERWQQFRRSLKGRPTQKKLELLDWWLQYRCSKQAQIQVHNYIGALKRGGQLSMSLEVQK